MGLSSSFYSGISGLATNGNAMSVIGNNIANSNTIGFKGGRTLFSDLLSTGVAAGSSGGQIGRGVQMAGVDNLFIQGTFENTEQNTDLAIEGEGFFMVKNPYTAIVDYTRAGAFRFNAAGEFVNPEGFLVQGYALDVSGNPIGNLTNIQVDPISLSAPRATTGVTLTTNLDASASYLGGFNIADPVNTSNYATSVTTFDSLGASHLVTSYFAKLDPVTNPLQWSWFSTVDGAAIGGAPGPVTVATGTLTFDSAGNLTGTVPSPLAIPAGTLPWSNGAHPAQAIGFTMNTTQYATPSMVISQDQDGYTSGSLARITVDDQGKVLANFTNGEPRELFQISMAKFTNPNGLIKQGNNRFSVSSTSGAPIVGTAGSGIGKIFTNALEQSNVDLAQEFVRMITTQRGFQASSKIITTTDEMLAELINLKR